jgi:formyltetrahydrofolate synthetase
MISAMLDNYFYHRRKEIAPLKTVLWRRVMDVNDRNLRVIETGLGGAGNGIPAPSGFDITPASEIMAILCLATSEEDLRNRIDNILLGYREDGSEFLCKELGVTGSIVALLKDALQPNLVQTTENTPVIIHGGPFANIAHGCNSILATKTGLSVSDYVITEAGFGADLGAEKFLDIKCRQLNRLPDLVVVVATCNGLKMHGGVEESKIKEPNIARSDEIKSANPCDNGVEVCFINKAKTIEYITFIDKTSISKVSLIQDTFYTATGCKPGEEKECHRLYTFVVNDEEVMDTLADMNLTIPFMVAYVEGPLTEVPSIEYYQL